MSRGYRVRMEVAERHVKSSDEVDIDISLLGILPEAEMKALLADQLKAEGWEQKGAKLVKSFGEVQAEIGEDMKAVTVRMEKSETVRATATAKKAAKEKADVRAEQVEKGLAIKVTRELSQKEGAVRESVQTALQRAYVTALEKKARAMGEVESIDQKESADGEIELVIKVKV